MRKLVVAGFSALAFAGALAPPASAHSTPTRLSIVAKITRFRATAAGVMADGTLTGKLRSGAGVSRDSAPVSFRVVAKPHNGRCDVLTLHLAPLNLELLGVQVTTSTINLDIYALKGRVLGNLFCALARAKVTFPHAARAARILNSRLHGRSMRVMAASDPVPASAGKVPASAASTATCQVLRLVLGPLHLDLLGLVVDLYGKTHQSPVIVTINAEPSKGLLGQLLCGLAGGTGITNISGLQGLLNNLGDSLTKTQLQNLLNQLGINLSSGLTQLDLQRILKALGLGSKSP